MPGWVTLILTSTGSKNRAAQGGSQMLRLVRLMRLARLVKLKRVWNSLASRMNSLFRFKIDILIRTFIVLFVAHILACFWCFIGESDGGWAQEVGLNRKPPFARYIVSLH